MFEWRWSSLANIIGGAFSPKTSCNNQLIKPYKPLISGFRIAGLSLRIRLYLRKGISDLPIHQSCDLGMGWEDHQLSVSRWVVSLMIGEEIGGLLTPRFSSAHCSRRFGVAEWICDLNMSGSWFLLQNMMHPRYICDFTLVWLNGNGTCAFLSNSRHQDYCIF